MGQLHHALRLHRTEEALTVLFCLVDGAYRLLNPRGGRHASQVSGYLTRRVPKTLSCKTEKGGSESPFSDFPTRFCFEMSYKGSSPSSRKLFRITSPSQIVHIGHVLGLT